MSRVQETFKNSAVSIVIQMVTIGINFISRTVLIKVMGEQYLGINGLFGNILNMLSLAELGIGSTITYWLYQPMANNDEQRLGVLMSVYARIYNTIGIVVLAIGLSLAPFLNLLMKETPDIPHLTIIYILYVVNMASSYFFIYKSSLINVAQKNYIVNGIRFCFFLITSILQIIALFLTRNYIIYYGFNIFSRVAGNLVISIIAERMFPFLKMDIRGKLTQNEKKEIKKDVSAIFSHNIGSFVLTGTDNIIISKFIGIIEVGLYSNYTMITHALQTLLNLIFNSLTSSVGNLINSVDKNKSYDIFKNILFAACWSVGFCCVCLYILFNPFITLWLGEKYIFDDYVVFIIVLNFYLAFIRRPVNVFKHCAGLFRKDKYKPFIESAVNLVVSIALVNKLGIAGVFIGTAVSTLVVCMYIEPYILYKYFYKKKLIEYFKLLFKYILVTVLSAIIIKILIMPLKEINIYSFVLQVFLCVTIPNVLFLICFYNTSELTYFKLILVRMIKKLKNRE